MRRVAPMLAAMFGAACALAGPPPPPAVDRTGADGRPSRFAERVFADEFDGQALDRSRWCTRYLYGGGPPLQAPDPACSRDGRGTLDFLGDEHQRYVDVDADGRPMHRVVDGVLHLMASAAVPPGTTAAGPRYAAGMIRSQWRFKPDGTRSYYAVARIRMPAANGSWPAFWLAPGADADGRGAWPPEIDIAEGMLNPPRGDPDDSLHLGTQLQNWGGEGTRGKAPVDAAIAGYDLQTRRYRAGRSLRGRWVLAGLEWHVDRVCFDLDRVRIACQRYEWIRNDRSPAPPATLLLNLALGGKVGGEVDAAALPISFDVDFVRVYVGPAGPALPSIGPAGPALPSTGPGAAASGGSPR